MIDSSTETLDKRQIATEEVAEGQGRGVLEARSGETRNTAEPLNRMSDRLLQALYVLRTSILGP